jgi:hypothetical protein
MNDLVFVGPTLRHADARALLPSALIARPIACGDVLRVLRWDLPIHRIAIIDGYFEGMAAVWHKEILLALERGIAVYGAASMGALRAAELAPFGMVGVGAIFRAYQRGAIAADDEVAVAHLPARGDYEPVGDSLVNLRFGLAAAARAGVITAATRDALLERARARFYRERSWQALLADADGVPARELEQLAAWAKPDQKAADARQLLRLLARQRTRPRPRKLAVPRTWALRQLERVISSQT